MNWWLARLKEPSTWRGFVWILTFLGLSLKPEQAEAIITTGMALAGLLGVFTSDAAPPKADPVELSAIELQGRATPAPMELQARSETGAALDRDGAVVGPPAGDRAAGDRAAGQRLRVELPAEHHVGPEWNKQHENDTGWNG